MAIAVTCQACGRQYNVKDEAAGKKFKCKDCGEVVSVPEVGGGGGASDDYGDPYNPYADEEFGEERAAAPPAARRPKRKGSGGPARERVNGPATGLTVCAAISLVISILAAVALPILIFNIPNIGDEEKFQVVAQLIGVVINIPLCIVILIGASRMRSLSSYGWAMAAAIISAIPCTTPCCLISIGMGIWALVVLNDADVKSAFR
jgi:hypothetical protein